MQIDWGWGASLSAHTSPMWGRGRLNSDTLPMSHFFIHTDKHTHAYGQRDGGGTVTTTCLALCRLSTPVTPARVDPSQYLSCFPLYFKSFTVVPFAVRCLEYLRFPFLSSPLLQNGLWIWAYLSQCRMFSGSGNVDSGPLIWLVRVGRKPGVKQVSSCNWYPWNHEPKTR